MVQIGLVMVMYHVNPVTGVSGKCGAKSPESCPFGVGNHYDSPVLADAAGERIIEHGAAGMNGSMLKNGDGRALGVYERYVNDWDYANDGPRDMVSEYQRVISVAERVDDYGTMRMIAGDDRFSWHSRGKCLEMVMQHDGVFDREHVLALSDDEKAQLLLARTANGSDSLEHLRADWLYEYGYDEIEKDFRVQHSISVYRIHENEQDAISNMDMSRPGSEERRRMILDYARNKDTRVAGAAIDNMYEELERDETAIDDDYVIGVRVAADVYGRPQKEKDLLSEYRGNISEGKFKIRMMDRHLDERHDPDAVNELTDYFNNRKIWVSAPAAMRLLDIKKQYPDTEIPRFMPYDIRSIRDYLMFTKKNEREYNRKLDKYFRTDGDALKLRPEYL